MDVTPALDYQTEFRIRHRMPRPIARAYEAVCFAVTPEELAHRSRWCARVALAFLGAARQATALASDPGRPVNPPSVRDLRAPGSTGGRPAGDFDLGEIRHGPLLRLAERPEAFAAMTGRARLASALVGLLPLAALRLAIADGRGLTVLLGPRLEYRVARDGPEDHSGEPAGAPLGTPLLVDPTSGRFVSLAPLAIWDKSSRESFGRLFLLERIEGTDGHYVEGGVPGSPGTGRRLSGRPEVGCLAGFGERWADVASPRARFRDGMRLEGWGRVHGLIWRGGTSDVFAAVRDADHGQVALKTFEDEEGFFDQNFHRFLSEERLSQRIEDGRVIVSRRLAGGRWGFVHEQTLARRGSLGDLLLTNGVLRPELAADVALQLLEALAAVHAAGVVHNDVKPDNILFEDDGTLRLIDFGIASEIGPERDHLRPGAPVGSAGYIAPEVCGGARPRPASDLFAVGVVLCEMLCGERPASAEAARRLRGVPDALRALLLRLLAPEPGRRFADAARAADALRRAQAGIRPALAVALDIEGTLVPSYRDHAPRPGLEAFLAFCLDHFARIFVYTTIGADEACEVFVDLAARGEVYERFLARYEYVEWPRGADGSRKDLRRCRVALEEAAIVDDMARWIPDDQTHRWVPVTASEDVMGVDRELARAEAALRRMFGFGFAAAGGAAGPRGPDHAALG